jgi:hypothetical protein
MPMSTITIPVVDLTPNNYPDRYAERLVWLAQRVHTKPLNFKSEEELPADEGRDHLTAVRHYQFSTTGILGEVYVLIPHGDNASGPIILYSVHGVTMEVSLELCSSPRLQRHISDMPYILGSLRTLSELLGLNG